MDRLMELIELKKYAEALKLFPALECEIASKSISIPDGQLAQFYTLYIGAYILTGNLLAAKYLWKRAPDALKQPTSFLSSLWEICQTLWWLNRDVAAALTFAKMLQESPSSPPYLVTISADIINYLREREMDLFGRSHSVMHIQNIAVKIGLTEEEAIQECLKRKWVIANDGFVTTVSQNETSKDISKSNDIKLYATYAAFLDKKALKGDIEAS